MNISKLKTNSNAFKDDEWYTPLNVFENLKNVFKFKEFDYDPATNESTAKYTNIKNFETIETNGLVQGWYTHKNIWINPPFTLKKEFITKAFLEMNRPGNFIENIFILIPIESLTNLNTYNLFSNEYDDNYYTNLIIPKGRIKFLKRLENGEFSQKVSPWFSSVIIHLSKTFDYKLRYLDLNKV